MLISKKQAKYFLLNYHYLNPVRSLRGKDGILQYIHRVGCIQFDPLNKVGRNPDLVLQSRVKKYTKNYLKELLYKDRKLLDGWDKNMSIYSVKDWPFFYRLRKAAKTDLNNPSNEIKSILPQVRNEIRKRGPLSSTDLDYNEKVKWSWAPTRLARAALESMYFSGELLIYEKKGTKKVYDFTKNHISSAILDLKDHNKTEHEYYEWYVKRRICSLGLYWNRSGDGWLGIRGLKSVARNKAINSLLDKNKIILIRIENIKDSFYISSKYLYLIKQVKTKIDTKNTACIIAPLDNLLWDRKMTKKIFDFDYKWEVFTPKNERKYGYYVLPILYNDQFVARFEPLKDKKDKKLTIKNWWWESQVKVTEKMKKALVDCMKDFASYLEVSGVILDSEKPIQNLDWIKKITA